MQTYKLGAIAKIQKGTSITKKDIVDGNVPVIAGGQNPAYFTNKSNRDGPIITISASGAYAGFVNFFDYPIFASDCTTVEPMDKSILDVRFLFLCLKSKQQEIYRLQRGAGQPHVYGSDLQNLQIPLPPVTTQRTIAERLDQIQELIDLKKQALIKTDELAKAIFLEMFGDPMTNEKGWDVTELIKFGEVKTGNTPSRKSAQYYGNFIEWIKSDNINTPDMFLTKADEYLSEAGITHGRVVNQGSVLVTCIAGSLSCIGNVAIANRKVAFNQQINAITPFKHKTNVYYLYALIENSKVYIQNHSTNSMKGMLSKGKFELIKFPLPPLPLQQQFAELITEIEAQKNKHTQALTKLEELYQAEMQRSFSL